MSSLKDWYRYVDSRSRRPAGSGAPPERERSTDEPGERPIPSEANAPSGERSENPSAGETEAPDPGSAPAVAGEEGLDIWSGLFPQQRKPAPKPTTAPLKRPPARRAEAPPDLPFTRTPIDSSSAPRFPRPEVEVSIPRFDEFVSPLTPGPAVAPPKGAPGASRVASASPVRETHSPPPSATEPAAAVPADERPSAAMGAEPAPALDAALQAGFTVTPSSSAVTGPAPPPPTAPPAGAVPPPPPAAPPPPPSAPGRRPAVPADDRPSAARGAEPAPALAAALQAGFPVPPSSSAVTGPAPAAEVAPPVGSVPTPPAATAPTGGATSAAG